MNKTKICPECGTENLADAFFCEHCNSDISFVIAIDSPMGTSGYRIIETPKTVTCPSCKLENPFNTIFCKRCFTALPNEYFEPVKKGERPLFVESRQCQYFLEFPWGTQELTDSITIGRGDEATPSIRKHIIESYPNVSHKHASFKVKDNTLYLYDYGSANGTYLNDILLPEKTLIAIRRDCPIRFAKTLTLLVKIIYNN